MNKKETTNPKELKNQNYEAKKMNTSSNLKKKKDKDLPWWVELLFVQIGLPDKLLIKILKAKKTSKEFIINEKKLIIIFLFVIATLAYFYPVIKHAKNKLDCEAIAKNYIIKNKNTIGINNREIKMLSTNFCYGGEEIYEIENLKN
jgi:amino acid permease